MISAKLKMLFLNSSLTIFQKSTRSSIMLMTKINLSST